MTKNDHHEYWQKMWNDKASSEDVFVQTGRSSSNWSEFFLMIQDMQKVLNLVSTDEVLDIGGAVGGVSMAIAPFVKNVTLSDYAIEMVKKAETLTESFENIRVLHDDLLTMKAVSDRTYQKVIIGSVLQYLSGEDDVKKSLKNIYAVMSKDGIAHFGLNPDMSKKKSHIESYKKLNWGQDRINEALKSEEKRLWLNFETIETMAKKIGFKKCVKLEVNPKIWQSTHMFDFMVVK
jgi:cyclopropane fatty-acyl-phospholipid synthase-like methyltransferase